MKVAVVKETRLHEKRVAASPDSVKRMIALGLDVVVETGAGAGSSFPDAAYITAGATIAPTAAEAAADAQVVLKVQRPQTKKDGGTEELKYLKPGTVLIGILAALQNKEAVAAYAKAGISAFAMELIPRITRAQSMDVLSSQSNLAGYKAVIDAAAEYGHAFPMMMTAAGTVPPARVTVMGAGVAGLQAIATARRLGAIVSAFDVRPVAKEQVESLGATFISVDSEETRSAETSGGYAKEMSEDYQRRQRDKIHEVLKKQDIVICTALIPGRQAPILVTKEMIADMKPGSVIVDLAVEAGGNAEGAVFGQTVTTANDVKIVGHPNVPSRIAVDASSLYARNILNFLTLLVDKETKALKIDTSDEIIKGTLLTQGGVVVHPSLAAPVVVAPVVAAPPVPPVTEPPVPPAATDSAAS